jgi:hypothetical protein
MHVKPVLLEISTAQLTFGVALPVLNAPGATTALKKAVLHAQNATLAKVQSVGQHLPLIALPAILVRSQVLSMTGTRLTQLAVQMENIGIVLIQACLLPIASRHAYLVLQATFPSQHHSQQGQEVLVELGQPSIHLHARFSLMRSIVSSAQQGILLKHAPASAMLCLPHLQVEMEMRVRVRELLRVWCCHSCLPWQLSH